jgi:hypothetical protein
MPLAPGRPVRVVHPIRHVLQKQGAPLPTAGPGDGRVHEALGEQNRILSGPAADEHNYVEGH